MYMKMASNSRDKALEMVEEGRVSAEDMLTMALKYMSTDDVEDMLDCNELSERFENQGLTSDSIDRIL